MPFQIKYAVFYLFIYFSRYSKLVGLHVVKNCLTNKYKRNKQTNKRKVLETVARFGV